MRIIALGAAIALTGCATEVYQAGKSRQETQRDIEMCKQHGILSAPNNPIRALDVAYDCLEQKGYQRGSPED